MVILTDRSMVYGANPSFALCAQSLHGRSTESPELLPETTLSHWFRHMGDPKVKIQVKDEEAFTEHINSANIILVEDSKHNNLHFPGQFSTSERWKPQHWSLQETYSLRPQSAFWFLPPTRTQSQLSELDCIEQNWSLWGQKKKRIRNTNVSRKHSKPADTLTGLILGHLGNQENTHVTVSVLKDQKYCFPSPIFWCISNPRMFSHRDCVTPRMKPLNTSSVAKTTQMTHDGGVGEWLMWPNSSIIEIIIITYKPKTPNPQPELK